MLYDEIMKIVTLAGELMLQAQDEELTVFDKEGTANFVTKHDKTGCSRNLEMDIASL